MSDALQTAYEQERLDHAARLLLVKAELLRALASINVSSVVIEYDGCGDNGQIESAAAFNADDETVSLETPPFELSVEARETTGRYPSLCEAVDDYAWDLLAAYHDGFEDGDGAFGTITIEISQGPVTIDHNERFTDSVNTTTEV
jgi:hypothetical protein